MSRPEIQTEQVAAVPSNDNKEIDPEEQIAAESNGTSTPDTSNDGKIGNSTLELQVDSEVPRQRVYHTGWRLHTLTAGLCVSLLLSTLETTIVSTSLVPIVNALKGFDRSSWVVTSYFLTYTGFLIIFAKLSDILGCKLMLLLAISFFTIFSIACGLSNSMLLLIIFRAFQGIGGSGIYALSTIMVPMMVPPKQYATYTAIITSMFAFSSVLGPLLGGAISDSTTWRWVFLLNGPGGALAAILLFIAIPFGFPYGESTDFFRGMIRQRAWRRIDFLGAFVSLAASVLIVFVLEEGGVAYAWNSGPIISIFVISGVLWLVFIAWERQLSIWNRVREPIFPWRLARNRFVLGLLLNGFLTGFPFMAAIINIPQRLQTVNATSAIGAGVRLLPLLLLNPIASASSGFLISKARVPPLYLLIFGTCLQIISVGLFSTLDSKNLVIETAQYGYQVMMGLGFGCTLSTILMMAGITVQQKDMPVMIGSATQIRVLGGTIGLAICAALLNNHIKTEALRILNAEQVAALLQSFHFVKELPQETQLEVRRIYANGYNQQMRVMMYFCIASLLSLVLLAERKPRKFTTTADGELAAPPE